jgi:serine protease Do
MEQDFNNLYETEHTVDSQLGEQKKQKKPRKKLSTGLKVTALVLVVALLGGVGGGAIMASVVKNLNFDSATPTMTTTNLQQDGQTSTDTANTLTATGDSTPILTTKNSGDKTMTPSEVYARYASAVVAISVESTTTNVFGQATSQASSGSGFIISSDGYIVTNYHVIENATSVTVSLYDETSYDATIVGYDSANDVALLKINATGLNTVAIGDSDDIEVGEQVAAIGNPLGELTFTLTCGYVSALDRVINTDGKPINMFQTDAAINPGNSGGPLFDMAGNVIGITTAKYASSSIEGLGFVIPINDVMSIVNDLAQYGRVVNRAYLGVTVSNMTDAGKYNLPDGAYIESVTEGSCADKAGIQAGDIVTGLGDTKIESYSDLVTALRNYKAGDTTTITVYQAGAYKDLTITFDERPADADTSSTTDDQQSESQYGDSGDNSQSGQSGSGYYQFPFGFGYGNAG